MILCHSHCYCKAFCKVCYIFDTQTILCSLLGDIIFIFYLTHWVARYTNIQGSQPSSFIIYPLFVHSLSFLTNQLNLYLPKIVYLNELFPAWFSTFILINILYKNTFLADREELTLFILYFKEGQRGNNTCLYMELYVLHCSGIYPLLQVSVYKIQFLFSHIIWKKKKE